MMTIQDMKIEYDRYKSEITTKNLEELDAYVLFLMGEIDNDIKILKKDKRNNKYGKLVNRIMDLLLLDTEDLSYYDLDNKHISEGHIVCNIYKNHYKRIIKNSNEFNCIEMGRLAGFVMECYKNDLKFLYSERDNLDYAIKGYGYVNNGVEDNSLVACDFIYGKIEELSQIKGIEKVKKM